MLRLSKLLMIGFWSLENKRSRVLKLSYRRYCKVRRYQQSTCLRWKISQRRTLQDESSPLAIEGNAKSKANQKGLALEPVQYFAEPQNRDLGIVKRSRKPKNWLLSPFPITQRSPEQFFFQPH